MLVQADFKALEWRAAIWYGQDKVGIQEVLDKVDAHEDNRVRFVLPDRVTAKKWLFKYLFGGTAYGYSVDPEFTHVSTKEKFWQGVIDEFNDKYKGIAAWHKAIILEAKEHGRLYALSGREYKFSPDYSKREPWPDITIKNYPVQGGSADIVMLARIAIYRRLVKHRERGILLTNSIHDSVVVDCRSSEVDFVCRTISDVVDGLPATITKCFGVDFNLPMTVEIETGPNLANMKEWNNAS